MVVRHPGKSHGRALSFGIRPPLSHGLFTLDRFDGHPHPLPAVATSDEIPGNGLRLVPAAPRAANLHVTSHAADPSPQVRPVLSFEQAWKARALQRARAFPQVLSYWLRSERAPLDKGDR